ncbi:MAG TPA: 16S rRNA (guanine(966)-N(2))-methyltransferase RsmD [Natronincola sp.]|nr:16S rRNA (guanine(966)-N(2))-methyltransferase RsmD [Natronincola sp.]
MRIISGTAKGTKLTGLPGQETRPTADRVKEALYNIIGASISGSSFLDLYAGNGGVGLEALSRGAHRVVLIDSNPKCTKIINTNRMKANFERGETYTNDVFLALKRLDKDNAEFDFIFMDPPYNKGLISKTLEEIGQLSVLKKDGIVIVEASNKEDAPQVVSKLSLMREQKYGDTKLYFYGFREELE